MREKKTARNVLIVAQLFYPTNSIGAIRPTKLAKKLVQEGYGVDVFTAPACSKAEFHVDGGYRIVSPSCIDNAENGAVQPIQRQIADIATRFQKRGRILTAVATLYRHILQLNKSRIFVQSFLRELEEGRLDLSCYECVITTFSPIDSLLSGMKAKQRRPELRWICDFRDPMVSQTRDKIIVPLYAYLQRKSIRIADCVTTVSHGYKKRIMCNRDMEKCIVIPNGFDEDDRITGVLQEDDRFSFAYVGSLYKGKRDLSLLFRALREMIDAGTMELDKLRFHYAGGEAVFLWDQAQKYGLEGIVEDHGQMPHDACLQLQASVRFLVMSTWNEKGEEGVFPGKLIEYMLMKKPIINITNGMLPNCEVTQVIRELDLGVSCEEADGNSYTCLKLWLDEQSRVFLAGKAAIFHPKAEQIDARYNWKNIVKRFGELIDG